MTGIGQKLVEQKIVPDLSQQEAIKHLELLARKFRVPRWLRRKGGLGIYLWGMPGRGKTMLMDAFYQTLTVPKRRLHWHAFLKELHQVRSRSRQALAPRQRMRSRTRQVDQHKQFDPWLQDVHVICFDEFHLRDPGNASLLGWFLHAAMRRRVSLVLTSNYHPQDLVFDSIHRHIVEPTVTLLLENFNIFHLDGTRDYRSATYHGQAISPVEKKRSESEMRLALMHHVCDHYKQNDPLDWTIKQITLDQRSIKIMAHSKHCLWMTFVAACESYRSYYDYLAMTRSWQVLAIQDIPKPIDFNKDSLQRFIALIDVFYDAKCLVLAHWPVPFGEWHQEWKKINPGQEVARCASRLLHFEAMITEQIKKPD